MGLLDDAIREHLELKRRSGADPSDIARLELEALGGAAPEPEPEPPPAPAEPEHEEHHEEQATQRFSAAEVEEAVAEHEPLDEAAPAPFDAEAPADHDELEETPEFLEETPEHERLWFDQKPPKDFDF